MSPNPIASTSSTPPPMPLPSVACELCRSRKRPCRWDEARDSSTCIRCLEKGLDCSGPSAPKQPSKTRKGPVINALRATNSTSVLAQPTPSATEVGARLAFAEMSAALSHHLVKMAVERSTMPDPRPVLDVAATCEIFRKRGFKDRGRRKDKRDEIFLACYIAIGSRRSNHSAITRGSFNKEALGFRRESTCLHLVDRALNLAESSGFLSQPSLENLELVSLLRIVVEACAPKHSFSHRIPQFWRIQCRALDSLQNLSSVSNFLGDVLAPSVIGYDAFVSANSGQPCAISDAVAASNFGWVTSTRVSEALTALSDPRLPDMEELAGWIQDVATGIFRSVEEIEKLGTRIGQSSLAITSIREKFHWLDVVENCLRYHSSTIEPKQPFCRWAPHLQGIPAACEAQLVGTLIKICDAREKRGLGMMKLLGGEEEEFEALVEVKKEAEVRFVRWLPRLIHALYLRNRFFDTPGGVHALAVFFDPLSRAVPHWVNLAVEAAVQYRLGRGQFVAAGFKESDLERLHECLRFGSSVFASTAMVEAELTSNLVRLALSEMPLANFPATDHNYLPCNYEPWTGEFKWPGGRAQRVNLSRLAQISQELEQVQESEMASELVTKTLREMKLMDESDEEDWVDGLVVEEEEQVW